MPERLKRIARAYGVSVMAIRGVNNNRRGPEGEAIKQFCYEAYATGRYSLRQIGAFLSVDSTKVSKGTVYWRVRMWCFENRLPYPGKTVRMAFNAKYRAGEPPDMTPSYIKRRQQHEPSLR